MMLCSVKSPPVSSLALMRSVLAASSSTVSTAKSKRSQPFPQLKVLYTYSKQCVICAIDKQIYVIRKWS